MRNLHLNAACVFAACLLSTQALAAPQVQLSPSLPSPQSTGTAVNLVATGSDSDPGMLTYRYSVANRGVFRVVRDYSQDPSFNWSGVVSDGTPGGMAEAVCDLLEIPEHGRRAAARAAAERYPWTDTVAALVHRYETIGSRSSARR